MKESNKELICKMTSGKTWAYNVIMHTDKAYQISK